MSNTHFIYICFNLGGEGGRGPNPMQDILHKSFKKKQPLGKKIEAGETNDRTRDLVVLYDCRHEGRAIAELRLRVESRQFNTNLKPICTN